MKKAITTGNPTEGAAEVVCSSTVADLKVLIPKERAMEEEEQEEDITHILKACLGLWSLLSTNLIGVWI